MNKDRPRQRLYLFTPALTDPGPFLPQLEAALSAGDIAAVLLRLGEADERTLINGAKAVAAAVQRRDIALLLDGWPDLVARSAADGAHLTGIGALRAALPGLKPDRIAGAGGLRSRDDAMLAGEAPADYVMFGEPRRQSRRHDRAIAGAHGEAADQRPPFAAVLDRVAWWAELFQPPCIGYAGKADEIGPLAKAGADFIALGDWIWSEPDGAETLVTRASAELAAAAG